MFEGQTGPIIRNQSAGKSCNESVFPCRRVGKNDGSARPGCFANSMDLA